MLRIYTYLQQDVRSHCPTFTSSCYQLKLFSFGCVFRAKLRGVQPLAIAIKTRRGWWLIAVSYKLHLSKHKSRSTTAIGSKVHLNYRYSFFFLRAHLFSIHRWRTLPFAPLSFNCKRAVHRTIMSRKVPSPEWVKSYSQPQWHLPANAPACSALVEKGWKVDFDGFYISITDRPTHQMQMSGWLESRNVSCSNPVEIKSRCVTYSATVASWIFVIVWWNDMQR